MLCKDPSHSWKVECLWDPPPCKKLILKGYPRINRSLGKMILETIGPIEKWFRNHRSNGKWSLDPKVQWKMFLDPKLCREDSISLLGFLSLLHHRLLHLQVLHLDCRLLECKYYNIHIPQFSRLGYKSGETVPVSRNRGRRVWLDILRAKLEAQPSSLRYAQPGGAGRNRENSGLKQFPLLHKNVSRVVFGRMAAF